VCLDAQRNVRLALGLLLAAGCGAVAPAGLQVTVVADGEVPRPTALSIAWLSDRGTLFQRDQIAVGTGATLASIFIQLDHADTSDRRILVHGTGPAPSIGAVRIPATASQAVVVTLHARLPDGDGDGLPDVIDDCGGCASADAAVPADAGAPEAGVTGESDAGVASDDAPAPDDALLGVEAGTSDTRVVPPDAAPVPPAFPVTAGLVGLWRMDEGAGGTVRDSSEVNNPGTLMRASGDDWAPGHAGQALALTGAAWLSVPTSKSYDASAGLTLSAWVFWPKATPAGQVIMARQRGFSLVNAFWLGLENNLLHFSVEDMGANVPMPAGRWVHVAGTYDGTKVVVYLDGALTAAASVNNKAIPSTRGISIGADINGMDPTVAASFFVGRLDDVAIFDRALSPAEVAALAK
jgi:hypothetical protein